MHGVTRLDVVEDVALVSFKNLPVGLGALTDIFCCFADNGIIIDMISQTAPSGQHVSVSFTCFDSDMVQVFEIAKNLRTKYHGIKPMVSSGNCKIRLYGEEMRSASGVFAKALQCLSVAHIELQQITTSETDISLLVTAAHLPESVRLLTGAFEL